jgi:hypothetical protein
MNSAAVLSVKEDRQMAKARRKGKIHPIIIYPYTHPGKLEHVTALYDDLIRRLDAEKQTYCRPITVLNRQTYESNERDPTFWKFLNEKVAAYSEVVHTWSVDTCQMWLAGFGSAYEKSKADGGLADVFWLIPGDFWYASDAGRNLIDKLGELPLTVRDKGYQLCLGEISTDPNSSKQLIDTYGTYGLLYNWFPHETKIIRTITGKPRTEFFAIGFNYLELALKSRWYAYEQTIVILLLGLARGHIQPNMKICNVTLGHISDDPQGRDFLAHAMQQVERAERVLKLHWREVHAMETDWPDEFRKLDAQSEQIRGAALVIFENVLRAG